MNYFRLCREVCVKRPEQPFHHKYENQTWLLSLLSVASARTANSTSWVSVLEYESLQRECPTWFGPKNPSLADRVDAGLHRTQRKKARCGCEHSNNSNLAQEQTDRESVSKRWYRPDDPMMRDSHFRADARRLVAMPIFFEVAEGRQQRGETIDLGIRGAFVRHHEPPQVGTPLTIELRPATAWDPLRIPACVRWISKNGQGTSPAGVQNNEVGFGVYFETLTPGQAAALHDLLETLVFTGAES